MPPIKKPRISLSCIVCRRRKVRCGREQPECANCVRMNETCVYQAMVRDESTGRVRPASSSPQNLSCPQRDEHILEFPALVKQSPRLSLRRGGHVRYIGPTFWGFVAGKETRADDFFDENCRALPNLPLPHISSVGMFKLLRSLPTKPVSDALLESFFASVWPLSPLLNPSTFQAEYSQFWDWCRNSQSAMPPEKLLNDPTWFCLLFAVLYCGGSAAIWTQASLHGVQKETTVSRLKSAYTSSLSFCGHQEHPTLDTLVSTLLTGPFLDRALYPTRNLVQVSTTVRMAQMMGLHSERAWSSLNSVERTIRRRLWWYIVWLDVQSSIATGLDPCCGTDTLDAVRIVEPDNETSDLTGGQSVAIAFASGRFQVARLQARIIAHLQNPLGPNEDKLKELVTDAKQLSQTINSLIALVSAQGNLDRTVSPGLNNASPNTNLSLYKDSVSQPTVFAAWARIMLTLLKLELAIMLQKPFLVSPDMTNSQSRTSWTRIPQLCVIYLRIYLQIHQTPSFTPYAWFCCSHYGPFQCVFIALMYLESFPESEEASLVRFLVDESIRHFVAHYQAPESSSTSESPDEFGSTGKMPLSIQVLVELHNRLDSSPREPEARPPSLSDTFECLYPFSAPHDATNTSNQAFRTTTRGHDRSSQVASSTLEAESTSNRDENLLATLETWLSSIILETNDFLANSIIQ